MERAVAALVARARAAQRASSRRDRQTLDTAADGRRVGDHGAAAQPAAGRAAPCATRASATPTTSSARTIARRSGCCATCTGRDDRRDRAKTRNTASSRSRAPVGVVAAITPSTNPAATPANKIINALKCGNAVIVAPSPKGYSSCATLIDFIHAEFAKAGRRSRPRADAAAPIGKAATAALMRHARSGRRDRLAGQRAHGLCERHAGVRRGRGQRRIDRRRRPRICDDAARKIPRSKTFDNATSCSSENSVVIEDGACTRACSTR